MARAKRFIWDKKLKKLVFFGVVSIQYGRESTNTNNDWVETAMPAEMCLKGGPDSIKIPKDGHNICFGEDGSGGGAVLVPK